LANTAEPLYLINRSGNRPSHEQADAFLDKAADLCIRAGFRKVLLGGDTKFAQTRHLDRWDAAGNICFIFGYEAHDCLIALADELPAEAYSFLERPPQYAIKTAPRQQPERVKSEIVKKRKFKTIHVQHEAKHKAERRSLLRMEFATFCAAFIQTPCQIIKGTRRLIYRLLSWNPWQEVFLRFVERLHSSLLR
jgi:hypothetical protein